jgi:hypothetical protein
VRRRGRIDSRDRIVGKPNRRQRRRIRNTDKYQNIKNSLDTNDHDTLLLWRLGDVQQVETGQSLNGPGWSPAHLVIGMSAGLRLQTDSGARDAGATDTQFDVSAPWLIRHLDHHHTRASVNQPGSVLIIDRRHFHLVERSLAGRVEPVGPIAQAFRLVKPAEYAEVAGPS